jgi:hypothetical protein
VKASDFAKKRARAADVCFGSLAYIEAPPTDVRFTPKADIG